MASAPRLGGSGSVDLDAAVFEAPVNEPLGVLDAGAFDVPATKKAAGLLADFGKAAPTLVLLGTDEANAGLSFRNLERVSVMPADGAGVADILGAATLVVSEPALEQI